MQLLLTWSVFVASICLLMLTIWWWLDTQADRIVSSQVRHKLSVRLSARGATRLAWLRLFDGILWLVVGVLILLSATPTNTRYAGRVVILLLMILEMAKLATDRLTRYQVDSAVEDEIDTKAMELVEVARLVEHQHSEVMSAIAVNTEKTEVAVVAADKAYTEANHVNQKIQDLNERLLQQEEEIDSRSELETRVSESTNEAIQSIEKHTASSAESLKAIEQARDKESEDDT